MDTHTPHDIVILYASQTGKAQYLSEEVGRELIKRDFSTEVFALDEYDVTQLPNEKFIIFIASTTGQGEVPDNMKNFWKFLLIRELPPDSLAKVKFSVFGLGDSAYVKFNAVARKLYQRLLQLGAKEFHTRGLGDDQHEFGVDSEFVPWLQKLIEKLKEYFPNKKYDFVENDDIPTPKYIVDIIKGSQQDLVNGESSSEIGSLRNMKRNFCYSKDVIFSKVTVNEKLTADDSVKEVRYIEIEAPKKAQIKYTPGDVAVLLPRNDPDVCRKLAERLCLGYNDSVKIRLNPKHKSRKNLFSSEPIPIRELFEYWLNIMEPPTRYLFRVLAYFTDHTLHKEKLREFGDNSNEGKIEYNRYCIKEKRNVYEVLFDFDTVNIPLNFLIETISLQKPREYSISTSLRQHPDKIGITIALTEYFTPLKRKITGVCSAWLSKAFPGEIVPLWIRKGTLPYPEDPEAAVICVGPVLIFEGTGIAPHLSLLEERVLMLEQKGSDVLNTYVLFGNRNENLDFIHKDKLLKWAEDKRINLITAFSRDQEQKVYVYHKIKEHKKELASFILKNQATVKIFICGNAKNMPKWVEESFLEILAEELGLEAAKAFMQKLQNERRYTVEAW